MRHRVVPALVVLAAGGLACLIQGRVNPGAAPSVLAQSRPSAPRASLEALLSRGQQLDDERNYVESIELYSQAIALTPASAEAWWRRGRAKNRLRRYADALADHERAVALDPEMGLAHTGLAISLDGLRRYDEAHEAASRGVVVDPGTSSTWSVRALVRVHRRDNAGAAEDASKAIGLDARNAAAWQYRGIARYFLKQHREADRDLTRAIELDPAAAQPYHWRGLSRVELKDYAGAIADYDARLAREPGSVESTLARAASKTAAGDREGAAADYRRVLELNPDVASARDGLQKLGPLASASSQPASTGPPLWRPGTWSTSSTPGTGWAGPFTYVQQNLGACWAATAVALIRAYGGNATMLDLLRDMRGALTVANQGNGRYGLPATAANYDRLAAVMNRYAPGAKFVRVTGGRSRRVETLTAPLGVDPTEWNDILTVWRPPAAAGVPWLTATGGHAYLFLMRLPQGIALVHDPRGTAWTPSDTLTPADEGGPYWERDDDWFEQFMRARNPGYAFVTEVIYPTGGTPDAEPPLQSVTIPSLGEAGEVKNGFVRFAKASGDEMYLRWWHELPAFYGWQSRVMSNPPKLGAPSMVVPRPYDRLELQAKVWNADRDPVRVNVRAAITAAGSSADAKGLPPAQSGELELGRGQWKNWSAGFPGLCQIRPERGTRLLGVEVSVLRTGTGGTAGAPVDHYTVAFELGPGPFLTAVTPASARVGDTVTIRGGGFGATRDKTATVRYVGATWTIATWTDTAITARVTGPAPGRTGASGNVTVAVSEDCETRGAPFTLLPDAPPMAAPSPAVPSEPPAEGGYWQFEKEWEEKPRTSGNRLYTPEGRLSDRATFEGSAKAGTSTATYKVSGPYGADCTGTLSYEMTGLGDWFVPGTVVTWSGTVEGSGMRGAGSPCGYSAWATLGPASLGGAPVSTLGAPQGIKATPQKVEPPASDRLADGAAPTLVVSIVLSGGSGDNSVTLHRLYRWVSRRQRVPA